MGSLFGRGYKARATKQHFGRLPTKVPEPIRIPDAERIVPPTLAPSVTPTRDADNRQWFVVSVAVKAHRRCYQRLRDLGYGVYLPSQTEWIRAQRRGPAILREVQRLPFGPYLFLGMRDDDSWLPLRETDTLGVNRMGITGILSAEGRPVPIRVQVLANIVEAERLKTVPEPIVAETVLVEAEGVDQTDTPGEAEPPALEVGSPVRIMTGSFSGEDATVDRLQGSSVRLITTLFGGQAVVVLPLSAVVPLPATKSSPNSA